MGPALLGSLFAAAVGCSDTAATRGLSPTVADPARLTGALPAMSLIVTVDSSPVTAGSAVQATAIETDHRGQVITGKLQNWTSSDTTVATVTRHTGLVTTRKPGSITLNVAVDNRTGSVPLSVLAPPPKLATIVVTLDSTSLTYPNTTQARATLRDSSGNVIGGSVAWSSSNQTVATVSSIGLVTGVTAGTADIIATSGTISGKATITVNAPRPTVASVTVVLASSAVMVGGTTQAIATVRDPNNNILTDRVVAWASSNPSIATVSATGLVTAVAAGNAAITATCETKSGSATVSVTAPPVSASLSGTVATQAGTAVGGGVVDVYSGATLVKSVAVAANGTFSVSSLPSGTYGVQLSPALAYSMGPGEPLQRSVTIGSSGASVAFIVQPALFREDFQRFTSSTQLTDGGKYGTGQIPAADFFGGADHDMSVRNAGQIFLDPTASAFGDKAMRYDWPAQPTNTTNYYVSLRPRFNPPPLLSELWVRFTDKVSSNFAVGGGGAVGSQMEYKYLFLDVAPPGYQQMGALTLELEDANETPSSDLTLRTKIIDFVSKTAVSYRSVNPATEIAGPGDYHLGPNYRGQWHTWVVGATGIGTGTTTLTVYIDGVNVLQIAGPWFPGQLVGGAGSNGLTVEMGANINNGPNQAQSRWWREIGVYSSRPSLKPLTSP